MASFDIDDRKMRSALPAPTSSTGEDLKWSGAFLGLVAVFIGLAGFVVLLAFRASF